MTEAAPVRVSLHLECSSEWQCYDDLERDQSDSLLSARTDQWWTKQLAGDGNASWIQVKQFYSDSVDQAHCTGLQNTTTQIDSRLSNASVDVDVCFSKRLSDGVDVVIPFDDVPYGEGDAFLSVIVEATNSQGMGTDMRVEMSMEPSQRKTVFIGVAVKEKDGKNIGQDPYLSDLFYNGKNRNQQSILHIRLSQTASLEKNERPGDLLLVW
eukprot:CAMPEP_0196591726 /NCGR_PEP_ID=MMETSP1081-20130531/70699_1 /TAXON_ID=36882 /ORGANISM="Pyramimonas amylifera, Strain CCMP720" /LENGTH=210 /DNA_ID=CAMNT_0041915185 /DNA_START=100 /DNA_END=729 /DNA_ORIENTATION=-